jgi:hypothetical protein
MLVDDKQSMRARIVELQSKLDTINQSGMRGGSTMESFSQLDKDEKGMLIGIMKEQSRGIKILMDTVRKSSYKLEQLDRVTQEVKKSKES